MSRREYQVIDTNMLGAPHLREYLAKRVTNVAVLTEYSAIEAYKASSADGIVSSMKILCAFPVRLWCSRELA
jgi:hypothetical protein